MTKPTKVILSLLFIVAILTTVSLVVRKDAPPDTKIIKIGFIGALSGEYGLIGENYVKGALLAKKHLEEQDSSLTVELIAEDDEFNTKKSLSAYQKLTNIDQIDALINETTPSIDAIYDLVSNLDMPVIQGGEQSAQPQEDNVFQIQPGFYDTEVALGQHLKEQGYRKPFVFVTQHPVMLRYFKGLEQGFGTPINHEVVAPGLNDFKTPIVKALEQKPDALVILLFPTDGAQVIRRVSELTDEPIQFVFDANLQAGFSNYETVLSDMSLLDGSIVLISKEYSDETFISSYQHEYNTKPGIGSAWGYDALSLLLKTYDSSNDVWEENIRQASYEGVSGLVEFDNVGVRKPDYAITTIKQGRIIF